MYQINPLHDPRWSKLLLRHPAAGIFHTPEWLEALRRTYGYEPIVFTTSAPGEELSGGIACCRVNSWLTGRRLVSVPFSDHCEPLVSTAEDFQRLFHCLKEEARRRNCKYIEIRPHSLSPGGESGLQRSEGFSFHRLDLRPTVDELFRGFHKSCIQRKIQRAEREELVYEEGRSAELLQKFYRLQVITRQRQQLAPQPFAWFRNLADCMGNRLKVGVASKDGTPVASILTLQFRQTLVYKYGCSDKHFSNLGCMPVLFWRAIQDAKREGLSQFDLGRSDLSNEGLISFKDRLGASKSTVTYWRFPATVAMPGQVDWKASMAKRIFSRLPNGWSTTAGALLYRHVG